MKKAKRSLHINAATRPAVSLRPGMTNTLIFLRLLRSPGHLTFLTANVALLVHLQFLSTHRRLQQQEKYQLDIAELQHFEDVVHDLDAQTEQIEKQILAFKLAKREKKPRKHSRNSKRTGTNEQDDGRYRALLSPQAMAKRLREENYAKNQLSLAQKYIRDREAYKSLMKQPEVLDGLFSESALGYNETLNEYDVSSTNAERPLSDETHQITRTYTSSIQNSLMLLTSLIIKKFLVEFNLRRAFHDETLLDVYPDEAYWTDYKLSQSLTEYDRDRILEILNSLEESGHHISMKDVLADVGNNEAFDSPQLKRHEFYRYKSGHWLNYAYSDVTSLIETGHRPLFMSPRINDDEYMAKISSLFSAYKADSHPFKHVNLALGVAKVLSNGGEHCPSLLLFRVLLDKFGEHGLYSYQTLVHDSLPGFENGEKEPLSERLDADTATQELYLKLIESDPQYLNSLINFEARKKNFSNLHYLLNYLEPSVTSRGTSSAFLPLFLKSKAHLQHGNIPQKALLVNLSTIESALVACVQIGDYERMDRILVKLFTSLTPSGTLISLSESKFSHAPNTSAFLSENILELLAETYIKRKDIVRLEWLRPHMSAHIRKHPKASLLELEQKLKKMSPVPPEKPKKVTSRVIRPEFQYKPVDRAVSMAA